MSSQIVVAWSCTACEVEGQDVADNPTCWNCGGAVTVTARPTVLRWPGGGSVDNVDLAS
jgi:hypothetical protein